MTVLPFLAATCIAVPPDSPLLFRGETVASRQASDTRPGDLLLIGDERLSVAAVSVQKGIVRLSTNHGPRTCLPRDNLMHIRLR